MRQLNQPDIPPSLDAEIGRILQARRLEARLTQRSLAAAAGLSQTAVTKLERGAGTTTLATLERAFAALGLRLHVTTEPLDSVVDVAVARLETTPWQDRIEQCGVGRLHRRLVAAGIAHVFTGAAAALLHGAPVPVALVDLLIEEAAMDRFYSAILVPWAPRRWYDRFEEYTAFIPLHPADPGANRWRTTEAEFRIDFVETLPEAVRLIVQMEEGQEIFDAVPMTEIELDDQAAGRMLRRYRERRSAQSPL